MQPENIKTRADFARYVEQLTLDLERNPEQWENVSLADFLFAIARWTEDMDGDFHHIGKPVPKEPTWSLFGMILSAASIYE